MHAINQVKDSVYDVGAWAVNSLLEHKTAAAAASALAAIGWYGLGLSPLISLPVLALGTYATNKLMEAPPAPLPVVVVPEPEVQEQPTTTIEVAPEPVVKTPQPPVLEEDLSYSKLKVALVFLALLPLMILWTALLILCLPAKIYNLCCKNQIHSINALYGEYFDILALGARFFSSESCHFTPGTGRPILLVHGYLHNASGWYAQIEHLKGQGLGPIYSIDLGDGTISGKFWSIRRYATQVQQKIQEIAQATGHHDIALVGHSMGGVVSSLAANADVADVITIGSPLHGTPVANCFGIGPDGREMHTDAPLLTEVQRGIAEKSARIRFRHIGSECDEVVPWKSAIMGTDLESNILFPDLGHASLMTSKKVSEKVTEWLRAG